MNSLNFLFRSRPYLHPLHPTPRHEQQPASASASASSTPLGTGPRETESELVDSMFDTVQRCSGTEAANTLERKAMITPDGQLRFGLPGITERRRTLNLNPDEDRLGFPPHDPPMPSSTLQPPDVDPSSRSPPSLASPILSELASAASTLTPAHIPAASPDHSPSTPSPTPPPPNPFPPPNLSTALAISMAELDHQHRYRRLARLLPIRLGVNLYILIRKFLALFGLRLPQPCSDDHHPAHPPQVDPPELKVTFSPSPPRTPLYSLFWRSDSPTSIIPDDEAPGSLVMTDASSSADDSDSTLSSNHPPAPIRSSSSPTSLLRPPPRQLNPRFRKSTTSTPSVPVKRVEKKAVLPGTRTKTLVLDLDETLIHSTSRLGGMGGNGVLGGGGGPLHSGLKVRVVEVVLDGRIVVYHVYKRPWVDFFLKTVASWYTVVIFTASMREYADPVIDWLDQGRGLIDGRLFRESCTNIKGSYMKDLTIIERDLSNVCLVDNSPISYGLHQANGIPIEGWLNDPSDEGLLDLLPMLDSLRFTKDVRRILGLRGFGVTTTTTSNNTVSTTSSSSTSNNNNNKGNSTGSSLSKTS